MQRPPKTKVFVDLRYQGKKTYSSQEFIVPLADLAAEEAAKSTGFRHRLR